MRIPAALSLAFLAASLSACIYVPVVDESKDSAAACETITKHMSMQNLFERGARDTQGRSNDIPINIGGGCNSECAAAILAAVVVVSAGSAIISGSIVLTGNTVHWLEYQGTCSDGYLNSTKRLFL
ncbi:hypothetical protein GALL_32720 [mine drainage metagenome]|uniref:Lipoprotein n=1 Tax=mine drainage metagenome TaxID=410659 RepID=A0A1J5T6P0_9ZZZZ